MNVVVCLGAHILDVLVRPVTDIPAGQDTALVEQMRMTAAGTAAGTALTFAKLGATVRTAGAIGADPPGDLLLSLLGRAGIDTGMVVRKADVPTSMSVLPIRPNGERPALHLLGANLAYTLDDVDWEAIAAADHLHLGGTEMLGPDFAARILKHAKENGVTTSVDLIAPGGMGTFDLIAPAMEYTDYLLPNEDQVLGFTGAADLAEGSQKLLDAGAGLLAITCGADGAMIVSADGAQEVPAFAVDVVDTTGCGDAFSAGFVYGMGLGRSPRDAAVLGNAVAALVAQGLGSDHGDFDLAAADALA
ncbi:sugar/nucleoside kinase (ribokinase family) [Mycobacterium sp. OAS707]|uniref:carbohydrate kinase family protein n=1 Tax=Mycobacterium sp. OAS707 TaxID=2663822 RepID=UPI001789D0C6|nr:carbohydrate kinase family protein [Mycobacterium sp. OAS707]MBE1551714.1 sugar/nucleoside kinase (ribokinase family) [Mycobacterium sp. OAS707]